MARPRSESKSEVASEKLDIMASFTPTASAPNITKDRKELAKEKLKELIAEETKLVKGIFQCFETPGSTTRITYRKYPGIEMFSRVMTDGETYEIPLYVARHLNGQDVSAGACGDPNLKNSAIGSCSYVVHGFKMQNRDALPSANMDGGMAVPIVGVHKRVKRYGFQSLEFGGV